MIKLFKFSLLLILLFSTCSFADVAKLPQQSPAVASKPSTININTADAKTIVAAHLKGIGEKRAAAIVAYRGEHGVFKSIDDLKKVKGIKDKIFNANKERLSL